MKQTITEKIFSKSCGREVKAGEIVIAPVDRLMFMETVAATVFTRFESLGAGKLYDPEMVTIIFDHLGCGHNLKDAETIRAARSFVRQYGIKNFFDLGRGGICHQVMVEKGYVKPDEIIVGTDSHSTTYGALGAFSCGVTFSEAAVILATGSSWFRVPETIRIHLTGRLRPGIYGKDVALKVIGLLGCDKKAIYKAIEFSGDGLSSLGMSDRLAICNMMAETGAKSSIVPFDEITEAYLRSISQKRPERFETSDPDAVYSEEYTIRLDELEPLVALPHTSENSRPASELNGRRIGHVFIGSCTNGRLEDLEVAASILRGRRIAEDVRMIVSPASQAVYLEAVKKGYIQTFLEAGALVESASCAACMGAHTGVLPSGEVAVSTSNRNFRGRMGSPDSSVYLASPATAAASAVEGRITDPRSYLG